MHQTLSNQLGNVANLPAKTLENELVVAPLPHHQSMPSHFEKPATMHYIRIIESVIVKEVAECNYKLQMALTFATTFVMKLRPIANATLQLHSRSIALAFATTFMMATKHY